MNLEMYCFENREGCPETYTTTDITEARRYASQNRLKLIARIFEYTDSELVEDYTEPEEEESVI